MFSGLSKRRFVTSEDLQWKETGSNVLGIPVDDVVAM
jgi:hypothetical protein